MSLPRFEYHAPSSAIELFDLLDQLEGDALFMAGGTDLLPRLRSGRKRCEHVVALKKLPELDGLHFAANQGLRIQANTILADLKLAPQVAQHYPVLARAIEVLATTQIRHKATIGGNLCNASPCADTAPPLLVLDASVRLLSRKGRRELPLEQFMLGPGVTTLQPGEILESIWIPLPPPALRTTFTKFSPRSKVDISAVSVAAALLEERGQVQRVHISLGTVAPTPMRARKAEALLLGRAASAENIEAAARAARKECRPITDFRARREYKQEMVYVLTKRALQAVARQS